ncbi:hypothetical protein HYALB_00001636 [Hymenoscyphus albidus]|uniref:Mediator of RNA polymerase II transcription subunit 11 n=1 Tax=Hymenoscyphus albidus TaxID=595503 RepID=A0A9N9PRB2_9HELO|nr:hypothetical protein HYALB_00001636 [Hymenoscyphus albidus]
MSQPNANAAVPFKPFTKAERIQQLNDIDKSITQLLQSAGQALQVLSHATTDPAREESFMKASNEYFKNLQEVDVGLKRQIWGLEEAEIIPAEKAKAKLKEEQIFKQMGGNKATQSAEPPPIEGGMGKLDIGWLNSRGGQVERDMEAELWAKARGFLEGNETNGSAKGKVDGDGDLAMES